MVNYKPNRLLTPNLPHSSGLTPFITELYTRWSHIYTYQCLSLSLSNSQTLQRRTHRNDSSGSNIIQWRTFTFSFPPLSWSIFIAVFVDMKIFSFSARRKTTGSLLISHGLWRWFVPGQTSPHFVIGTYRKCSSIMQMLREGLRSSL